MNQLIGQLMLMGVSGPTLTSDEKKFIVENNISGVVLFNRNLIEPKQIRDLCAEIQSLRHQMIEKAPLFIGVDMEGGRVHRLKEPFTKWPALKKIGDLDNATVTYHFAHRMGLEIKAIGMNLNFAPCVDVLTEPKNTAIGDRAISSDFKIVDKHTSGLVRGYIKAGVITCAKHFPGHGNTLVDSHDELPVEKTDLKTLSDRELIPFKKAFKSRVDMVMTSHILFEKIDAQNPVIFSELFIEKILKESSRYRGLIITDDLDMGALIKNYEKEEIPVKALKAGVDLLLYCNVPDSPPMAIEAVVNAVAQGQLNKSKLENSYRKILELKKEKLTEQVDPLPLDQVMKIVGHPDHLKIAAAVAEGKVPAGLLPE